MDESAIAEQIGDALLSNRAQRALIFDLDGTLVDSVYAHMFAWQRAFAEVGLPIDGSRIHRASA
jgi:FMN phosphatase YigB (HAD superfamily)